MTSRCTVLGLICVLGGAAGCLANGQPPPPNSETSKKTAPSVGAKERVVKSDEQWKKSLSPEQYRILRKKGTERAFTGKYNDEKRAGTYVCAGCGHPLFHSDHKFDSGSGWPSFYKPVSDGKVEEESDTTFGMTRTEILCARCGGHLGHVFRDGPNPTGLRYCVNSASLTHEADKTTEGEAKPKAHSK